MGEYGIAAFRSRQQVMRFEQALRREGVKTQVISTPRDVAIGCGLSVRFDMQDVQSVQNLLNRMRPANLIGLYSIDPQRGRGMKLTAISKYG